MTGSTEDAAKVARHTIKTQDPELAHEVIAKTYGRHRPRISGSTERFRFSLRTAGTGPMSSDLMQHSMNVYADVQPLFNLTVGSVAGGSVLVRRGREEERFGPGDVVLYPYGVDFDVQWTRFDQGLLRLRFEAVAELAAQTEGTDAEQFRFLGMRPVSAVMARYWRSVATFVQRELAGDGLATLHPLLLAETENTVASAALCVFPNTTHTASHQTPAGQVGPAALRRAVAYIDAHAGEAITLTDIAANVGVGARALQRAFAVHHDTTPMGYLRRVRLENAHRDLQRADPRAGDDVARIARQWGFGNPGRFADLYRSTYRVAPDQTLRAT